MKWLLFLALFVMSCNDNGMVTEQTSDTVSKEEKQNKDSSVTRSVSSPIDSSDSMIIPGERLGKVRLGDEVSTLDILGPADESDAAMGKAWLTWKGKRDEHNNVTVLKIYTTYKDSRMMEKTIQQIRTTSSAFHTRGNNHVYSSLNTIRQEFPRLKKSATYKEEGREFTIYDDVDEGIAFEIVNANGQMICTGIIVHEKKKKVTDVYITLHPEMKIAK